MSSGVKETSSILAGIIVALVVESVDIVAGIVHGTPIRRSIAITQDLYTGSTTVSILAKDEED